MEAKTSEEFLERRKDGTVHINGEVDARNVMCVLGLLLEEFPDQYELLYRRYQHEFWRR